MTWNLNASEQSMSDFNRSVTVANEETLAIFPVIPLQVNLTNPIVFPQKRRQT